ncbi:MAG: hypothetical protein ACT4OM_04205 [Actinomycetota bacterium]
MDNVLSGRQGSPATNELLDWGGRLAAELDPRLADVWSCLFSMNSDLSVDEIAWFLRMAYLNGYEDGLTEVSRGALLEQLGISVPSRGSIES